MQLLRWLVDPPPVGRSVDPPHQLVQVELSRWKWLDSKWTFRRSDLTHCLHASGFDFSGIDSFGPISPMSRSFGVPMGPQPGVPYGSLMRQRHGIPKEKQPRTDPLLSCFLKSVSSWIKSIIEHPAVDFPSSPGSFQAQASSWWQFVHGSGASLGCRSPGVSPKVRCLK